MANSANLDLGFQSRMAYRAIFTGKFTKARELAVTLLFHVVIGDIEN